MTPFRMILLMLAISHQCTSQSCLTEGITFDNQAQIDNFSTLYPNCTTIEGDVKIGDFIYPYLGTDIVDLTGLSGVDQINGSLNIFYNSGLEDLTGLSNLIYIGNSLTIDNNDALIDLQGLEGLTSVNGSLTIKSNGDMVNLSGLNNLTFIDNSLYISTNPSLISFIGLNGVTHVNGYFSIANNDALVNFQGINALTEISNFVHIWSNDGLLNLQGLESLTTVGGFFAIQNNDSLDNVDGLNNLGSIGSYLSIYDNSMLSSIDGIGNIDPATIQASSSSQNDIEIYDNVNLSSCALDNVCSVFNTPSSNIYISNNGVDCESISDIDSICNPSCGMVTNLNSSGEGSLNYGLDCVLQNDTLFIDEALAQDTIWMSELTIDQAKSFILKGPNDRILIASTMESPLVNIMSGEQIHLINIDLYKFYPTVDTIIYNQGTLILENCDIYKGTQNIIQSESAQLIIRGNTKIKE